jgi:hypothetical protein
VCRVVFLADFACEWHCCVWSISGRIFYFQFVILIMFAFLSRWTAFLPLCVPLLKVFDRHFDLSQRSVAFLSLRLGNILGDKRLHADFTATVTIELPHSARSSLCCLVKDRNRSKTEIYLQRPSLLIATRCSPTRPAASAVISSSVLCVGEHDFSHKCKTRENVMFAGCAECKYCVIERAFRNSRERDRHAICITEYCSFQKN